MISLFLTLNNNVAPKKIKVRMISQQFFIFSVFCLFFHKASANPPKDLGSDGTVDDRTRILKDLLTGYDKRVNPDNTTVKFGVALINFGVNDLKSSLDSNVWLRYTWFDERLKWNPNEYGNMNVFRLDSNEIWKPDITLYNSADPKIMNCWQSNVLIYPNGEVLWVPPCKLTSQCQYTTQEEPYGEQTCSLKFGSWTYDGNILDMQFYNSTAEIDFDDLSNSSGFEIISTSAVRNIRYYSCCAEPYVDLTFYLTIKRIPGEELVRRD